MRASWLVGCSLVSMFAACAGGGDPDDKAPGDWVPGKGDGAFDLVEVGPAPVGGKVRVALEGRVPAYRGLDRADRAAHQQSQRVPRSVVEPRFFGQQEISGGARQLAVGARVGARRAGAQPVGCPTTPLLLL